MNLKQTADFLDQHKLEILHQWCPYCGGQIVEHQVPDRVVDHVFVQVPPMLCLDCDRRMGYGEPTAMPLPTADDLQPADRIKARDLSRAEWQVEEEKRVYLAADVIDQVIGRL